MGAVKGGTKDKQAGKHYKKRREETYGRYVDFS